MIGPLKLPPEGSPPLRPGRMILISFSLSLLLWLLIAAVVLWLIR